MLENGVGAYNEAMFVKYGFSSDNIIRIGATASDTGLHPTQKPLELMKMLIELTTVENQIVLDPFCGSGTTLLAAKELNRNYIGFEKEELYVQTSKKRLNSLKVDNTLNFDYSEIADKLA